MIEEKKKRVKEKKDKIMLFVFVQMMLLNEVVYAGEIGKSKIAKGTKKLLEDMTDWLEIIAPVVGVVLVIYFFIKRASADEQDQKRYTNRITTVIVSTVGAILGSVIINLVLKYYK